MGYSVSFYYTLVSKNIYFRYMLDAFGVYFEIILNRKWLFACRNTS